MTHQLRREMPAMATTVVNAGSIANMLLSVLTGIKLIGRHGCGMPAISAAARYGARAGSAAQIVGGSGTSWIKIVSVKAARNAAGIRSPRQSQVPGATKRAPIVSTAAGRI